MARTAAQIQADITAAEAQLAKEQAEATAAQATAAKEAADVAPVQSKLGLLKAELAALPPPTTSTPSPNGTTITPGVGSIIDRLGQKWTVGADKKNYRDLVAVPSSSGVQKLVVDGLVLKQWNGKDWWSQPIDFAPGAKGDGVIVGPPGGSGPVVIPPPDTPPGTGGTSPVGNYKKLLYSTNFTSKVFEQFDTFFNSFGTPGQPNSRGYDAKNQPWICIDKAYCADLKLPEVHEFLQGGGVRLHTWLNPHPEDKRLTAYSVPGLHLAGVLMAKQPLRPVNSYMEWKVVVYGISGAFPAGWSLGTQGDEIDDFEHQGIWGDKSVAQSKNATEDRLFWGAPDPKHDTHVAPNPFYARGIDFTLRGTDNITPVIENGKPKLAPISPISGVALYIGCHWTNESLIWYVNRQSVGGGKNPGLLNPQKPILNNVVGGWDGQQIFANIKPHTYADFLELNIWG